MYRTYFFLKKLTYKPRCVLSMDTFFIKIIHLYQKFIIKNNKIACWQNKRVNKITRQLKTKHATKLELGLTKHATELTLKQQITKQTIL